MPGKRIFTLCQNWYSEVGKFKLELKIRLVRSSDYQSFFLPANHLHASHSGIIIRDSCGEAEGRIDMYWGKTLLLWLFGDSDIPVPSTPGKMLRNAFLAWSRFNLMLDLAVFLATSRIELHSGRNGCAEKVLRDWEPSEGCGDWSDHIP